MLQPIDNPQPMYIPTRISPDVVASSRQLIPLGTVEMGGKSYYRFELGSGFFSAVKFYEVDVIRSINQMSENEVNETEEKETNEILVTIEINMLWVNENPDDFDADATEIKFISDFEQAIYKRTGLTARVVQGVRSDVWDVTNDCPYTDPGAGFIWQIMNEVDVEYISMPLVVEETEATIEPAEVVAEPEQTPAPVVSATIERVYQELTGVKVHPNTLLADSLEDLENVYGHDVAINALRAAAGRGDSSPTAIRQHAEEFMRYPDDYTDYVAATTPGVAPAPVVEPEVESEPGAKIVRWYANNASDRQAAETEIAALEAKGWLFRGMAAVGGSDGWDGEYSVLYVKPQAAVSS